MAREILKVRKVGGTLVVTLTQGLLEQVELKEGDRILVEAIPPRRILITKEGTFAASTRRVELELQALEAKKKAIDSDIKYKIYQYNSGMPTDEGMSDESVAQLILHDLAHKRDEAAANIASKRLELFELEGDPASASHTVRFIKSDSNISYDVRDFSPEGSISCAKNCGRGTYTCLISRDSAPDQQELLRKREHARMQITDDCPFHEKRAEFEL